MTTQQEENLINLLDGYVEKGGHHLNVNVFNRVLKHILKNIRSLRSEFQGMRLILLN